VPQINGAIALELANGTRDALRGAAVCVTGNQANYIKDFEPSSIYGRIQQATARLGVQASMLDDPSQYSGAAAVLVGKCMQAIP